MPEPRRLLYVLTSNGNMGDLALCADWAAAFAAQGARCAFAYPPQARKYLPPSVEAHFPFEPAHSVWATIAQAAEAYRPAAIIFATGTFWSIPGQPGAEWGHFDDSLTRLGIPLLSFDPMEGRYDCHIHITNSRVCFPPVPPEMWALRYMSPPGPLPHRAWRFRLTTVTPAVPDAGEIAARKRALGLHPNKPVIMYCVSGNRLAAVRALYFDYFHYLARLLEPLLNDGAQLLLVGAQKLHPLDRLPNIVLHPACDPGAFFTLLNLAHVFLTDSLVSSLAYACFAGIPSVLLGNTLASPDDVSADVRSTMSPAPAARAAAILRHIALKALAVPRVYRGPLPGANSILARGVFPWIVFPYGLNEMRRQADETYGMASCYREAPFFDPETARHTIAEVIAEGNARSHLLESCQAWARIRAGYPAPPEVLEDILAAEHV